MKFEAAIFDLDGTLLNSMDVWKRIDDQFLQKRHLPVQERYVTDICSLSFEEAAQYTIELFGLHETARSIIDEWNEMAEFEYTHHVKLMPYTRDYLERLRLANVRLAVATGLPERLYKPCLENNGILDFFDVICSTEKNLRGKEYPDIFEMTARKLNIIPEKCIVFDDVLPAIKSAKQAGMIACGVFDKYSAHLRAEIEEIADYYLLDFKSAPFPFDTQN